MRSLYWKITIPFVLITILGMAALGFYTAGTARGAQLAQLRTYLINESRLVADDSIDGFTASDATGLDALAKTIGQQIGARITLIATNGTVLGDSWEDPANLENHSDRPEVLEALATGVGVSTRFSTTIGENMMYAAVPVVSSGLTLGVARVALPLTEVENTVGSASRTIIIALLVIALIVILLTAWIIRHITYPLRQITRATEAMAAGQFAQKVPVGANDELGRLGHAFNLMASQLDQTLSLVNAEKSRLEALLANLPDGIVMTDRDGSVVFVNQAAARLFHVVCEMEQARSIIEVVHDHEIEALYKKCLSAQREITAQVGTRGYFLRVIAVPLIADQPGGALLLFQDLTQLRSLQTMRQEFVANVSHELRTPLAGIKAIVETLKDGAIEDKKVAGEFLERVDIEVDKLSQMISELMELSRIESGKAILDKKPLDLNQLILDTIAHFSPQTERHRLTVKLNLATELPDIPADGARIMHVITNILDNAIKFTPAGGQITISSKPAGSQAVVSIADTGIGISPEDLTHIFERFYKADKSRTGQGTGLGLAIAKHTVQAHGGQIWADSEPGKGSVFSFSLPLSSQI
jgi:two-component system phosphate regulon sensor histidine kinase PhoR